MFQSLFNHIGRYVTLDEKEQAILSAGLQYRKLEKKDHLLKEGAVCTANYFILDGCLRLYFISETGKEQTIQFGIENWWISDLNSMAHQTPSPFFIQAIEISEVAILDRQAEMILLESLPKLERYFRLILQRAYAASAMRLYYLSSLSGAERYDQFTRLFPGFIQRIPQYMLASYLGFTPEFLSRIRARKG
jgi:CRP-like cAMP-binding protein